MGLAFEKKTFLTIFVIISVLEFVVFYPYFLMLCLVALLIFFTFALFKILNFKPHEKSLYPVFVLPIILLVEAFIVINSIPLISLKHLFIAAFGFLLYLIIFSLKALKRHVVSYSVIIFNILTIAYLVSVFFAYVSLYNFYLLLGLSSWIMMILVGIVTFLSFRFNLWQNELLNEDSFIYNFLITIIIVELFWVLTFWPVLALPAGFIIFLFYYAYADLFSFSLKKSLTKKVLLGQVLVPFILLIFFLVSLNL